MIQKVLEISDNFEKVQITLVLCNKKIDDHKSMSKIFHFSANLTVNDSDIDEAFGSMHQSVMTKIENSARIDWIVKITVEHDIKISEC